MIAVAEPWASCRRAVLAGLAGVCLSAAAPAAPPMIFEGLIPAPDGQTNHAPGLVGLADGELLSCWYSGTTEANADSRILCANSADHGHRWTAPRVVVDRGEQALGARAPNKSVGNVTLHFGSDGRLWLIYGVIQRWDWPLIGNVCRNWLCGRVDAKVSLDQGATWSAAVRFDDRTGALPRGKPVRVDGLGDVIPLYREGAAQSMVEILDLAQLPSGHPPVGHLVVIPGASLIQPSLVIQADGRLRAFLRDSRAVSIHTSVFDRLAGTWSVPIATDLPNPGAAAESFRDEDGDVVLVYNPSTADRRTLRLASTADGVHFRPGCDLVSAGRQGDVAYPTVIRTADGDWHVVYSSDDKRRIRHIAFNTAWLRRCLGAGGR